MHVEDARMYRVREVAERLNVSVATIYRAIETGQLTALKLGTNSGTLRVSGAAVQEYLRSCEQAARQDTPAQDGCSCGERAAAVTS